MAGEQGRWLSYTFQSKSPYHLRAASSPAGQTPAGSSTWYQLNRTTETIPSNCQPCLDYLNSYQLIPHFITPNTWPQTMALHPYILLFLHLTDLCWDVQTCPEEFPGTTNCKTQDNVCEPNNKSFIYTEAWVKLREWLVLCHRLPCHTDYRQVSLRVLLLTLYRGYRKNMHEPRNAFVNSI